MKKKKENEKNRVGGWGGEWTLRTLNGQELQSPPDRRRVSGNLLNQDLQFQQQKEFLSLLI